MTDEPGSSAPRVVVLGTGTDVGKTWVTCALARGFRAVGRVAALKPIETGYLQANSDSATLARAAEHADPQPLFRLELGVTPLVAARAAGVTLDLAAIPAWVTACEEALASTTLHVTLIESAGGVFSPLTGAATNFELAALFPEARWLLVADNRLGVLHDVIASYEAMRARGRTPDVIVLNGRTPDVSTPSNADVLRGGLPQVTIHELGGGDSTSLAALLRATLGGS